MKKNSLFAISLLIIVGVILYFIVPWDNIFSSSNDENSQDIEQSDIAPVKKFGYIMTIDEERYKWSEEEENVLVPKEPLEEKYPEVSMRIEQYPDTPEEILPKLEEKMREAYSTISEPESIMEPVKGFKLHGIDQENGVSNWDSPVSNIYVIGNGRYGSFVITEKYFIEAAEGHGANFYHMLETFEIKALPN